MVEARVQHEPDDELDGELDVRGRRLRYAIRGWQR
jgi:hypothetical protein